MVKRNEPDASCFCSCPGLMSLSLLLLQPAFIHSESKLLPRRTLLFPLLHHPCSSPKNCGLTCPNLFSSSISLPSSRPHPRFQTHVYLSGFSGYQDRSRDPLRVPLHFFHRSHRRSDGYERDWGESSSFFFVPPFPRSLSFEVDLKLKLSFLSFASSHQSESPSLYQGVLGKGRKHEGKD